MYQLYAVARDRFLRLKRRREQRDEIIYTPAPPLNESLADLSEPEIRNELAAVMRRLELGHTEPEGVDGLRYRLKRLEAQAEVMRRKDRG